MLWGWFWGGCFGFGGGGFAGLVALTACHLDGCLCWNVGGSVVFGLGFVWVIAGGLHCGIRFA